MRISDWSSDVCSSDLKVLPLERALQGFSASITGRKRFQTSARSTMHPIEEEDVRGTAPTGRVVPGDRQRGVSGKSVSVRVDLGGRRLLKRTHETITQ